MVGAGIEVEDVHQPAPLLVVPSLPAEIDIVDDVADFMRDDAADHLVGMVDQQLTVDLDRPRVMHGIPGCSAEVITYLNDDLQMTDRPGVDEFQGVQCPLNSGLD